MGVPRGMCRGRETGRVEACLGRAGILERGGVGNEACCWLGRWGVLAKNAGRLRWALALVMVSSAGCKTGSI